MSKAIKIGDKVRYIGINHEYHPKYYPAIGTIGIIKQARGIEDYWVQWPKGATMNDSLWTCYEWELELVKDNDEAKETSK